MVEFTSGAISVLIVLNVWNIIFYFRIFLHQFSQIRSAFSNFLVYFVVVQSLRHVQLCDPMDCSTPGFPILHYLLEFVQTHVHWVDDTIQPSHPLSLRFPPALSLSQHQGLFQWINSLHCLKHILASKMHWESSPFFFVLQKFVIYEKFLKSHYSLKV